MSSAVSSTGSAPGNDVGGTLDSPTKGLSDLGLGGGLEKNKALLDYGNPLASETSQGNTCPTGHRYCCKDVRRYTDPRNAALINGVLTLDDQLNKHLLGLNCHAITGSLVTGSCRENAVCCTGQHHSKQGPLNIGCTSIELSATN
ncbi:unnamed protein product [Rhizoctonia solani]|uniref:Hydrophobin n=1 Tax=Rhizoctonia solani TaxID=456999 RepID=A0A8H3BUG7_9AGAM|nr:unnamed protein product [Rhizoctonia solani]CAE6516265.1 unnamed protein product [Rhizoctonia solani]